MGLDNGMNIRKNKRTHELGLDERFYDAYSDDTLEVFYWRKWWGVRNDVVNYLCATYGTDDVEYKWKLTTADVKEIARIVASWDDRYTWEVEHGSTIWEYEEVKGNIDYTRENLQYLIEVMEKHEGEFEVYFYDSY